MPHRLARIQSLKKRDDAQANRELQALSFYDQKVANGEIPEPMLDQVKMELERQKMHKRRKQTTKA